MSFTVKGIVVDNKNAKPIIGYFVNGVKSFKGIEFSDDEINTIVEKCIENNYISREWYITRTTVMDKQPIDVLMTTEKTKDDFVLMKRYVKKVEDTLKRNIVFDLTLSQYKKLINTKKCYYTDVVFDSTNDKLKMTIDRLDNNIGYTIDNCVACCHWVNQLKSDLFENPASSIDTSPKTLLKILSKMI